MGNSKSENPALLTHFLRHIKTGPTAARPISLEPCLSRINYKATQPVLYRVGVKFSNWGIKHLLGGRFGCRNSAFSGLLMREFWGGTEQRKGRGRPWISAMVLGGS